MRNDRRDIYFYDLEVRALKKAANAPPITDVISVLQTKLAAGEAVYKFNHGSETLSIREIEIDEANNAAILLIIHTDPAAPNAVYSNPEEGTARIIEKEPGEAGEYGAHLIISLEEVAGRPGNYLAVIERVPSLGRSFIERVLNSIINDQYKANPMTFSSEDKTGKRTREGTPKMVGFRPHLRFAGHPSESFIRDLEQGCLSGITLTQAVEHRPLGGRPYLVQDKMSLKARVSKGDLVDDLWHDLKQGLAMEADNWEEARIEFTTPDGLSANITVETTTGNVLDDAYVRSTRLLGIDPLLDHSSNTIVRHLVDIMMEQFLAKKNEVD